MCEDGHAGAEEEDVRAEEPGLQPPRAAAGVDGDLADVGAGLEDERLLEVAAERAREPRGGR